MIHLIAVIMQQVGLESCGYFGYSITLCSWHLPLPAATQDAVHRDFFISVSFFNCFYALKFNYCTSRGPEVSHFQPVPVVASCVIWQCLPSKLNGKVKVCGLTVKKTF